MKKLLAFLILNLLFFTIPLATDNATTDTWHLPDWNYRMIIEISTGNITLTDVALKTTQIDF